MVNLAPSPICTSDLEDSYISCLCACPSRGYRHAGVVARSRAIGLGGLLTMAHLHTIRHQCLDVMVAVFHQTVSGPVFASRVVILHDAIATEPRGILQLASHSSSALTVFASRDCPILRLLLLYRPLLCHRDR
ncbi:unnamed protein product [Protopolystoma xenopodis]|uniref:Uncharacterized protein n=1 Tax=Protopolystoma xenopodis TaxID=117903 RepID=A0A3S5ALS8_9PLAT|nr:unnamed protein product [Protopolystoma xenopodis]